MEFSGPMNYPRERGSLVGATPTVSEGPAPFYPPMCLKTHWDPTAILRKTLPTEHVQQALDPRPWARICMEYTTTGEQSFTPQVSASVVLPSGGQFYPVGRYMEAIDKESELRRLDRPLGTCDADQWEPNQHGDMYNPRLLVPTRMNVNPALIQEVAFPKTVMTSGPYDCRKNDDMTNVHLSDRRFNNATKQDRYKLIGKV